MNREEKLELLREWEKVYNELEAANNLVLTDGPISEAPLMRAGWRAFHALTTQVGHRIGDITALGVAIHLTVYYHDCMMDKGEIEVDVNGKEYIVQDLETLLDVIEALEANP